MKKHDSRIHANSTNNILTRNGSETQSNLVREDIEEQLVQKEFQTHSINEIHIEMKWEL
jgi:hypothetical protein